VVDGVDGFEGDELDDLRGTRRRRFRLGELLRGDHHQLAALGLVSLGDLRVRDLLAVLGTDALVPDLAAVLGMDLAEAHVVVLRGRVQAHGDADQTELHVAVPDRPHGTHLLSLGRAAGRRDSTPNVLVSTSVRARITAPPGTCRGAGPARRGAD